MTRKEFKCFMSAFLADIMIVSTFSFLETKALAEDLSLTPKSPEYLEIAGELLCGLGIIDEEFLDAADRNVTQGELAELVCKTLNIPEEQSDEFRPVNLNENDESAKWMSALTAVGMTTLSDTKKFYPSAGASTDMLLGLMIDALGYRIYLRDSDNGFPMGERIIAAREGLLKYVDITSYDTLSRAQAVIIICNALRSEMVLRDLKGDSFSATSETMISNYHHLMHGKGKITMNFITGLKKSTTLGKGYVMIGENTFEEGTTNASLYLGSTVEYYYDKDGVLHGIFRSLSENKVRISARDIVSVSEENIIYLDENEHKRTFRLDSGFDVLYNGKAEFNYTKDLLIPLIGYVELKDFDGDDKYDIYDIHSFQNIIVSSIDPGEKRIFDIISRKIYDFGDDGPDIIDYYSYNNESNTLKRTVYEKIKRNNILSIEKSLDGEYMRVYISSYRIQGRPQSLGEDFVEYDGKKIRYSKAYIKGIDDSNPNMYKIDLKSEGVSYIDCMGELAYWKKGEDELSYGFLSAFAIDTGLRKSGSARILTAEGQWQTLKCAKEVWYKDRKLKDVSPIYSDLCSGGKVVPQLIKYRLNADEEIDKIELFSDKSEDTGYVGYDENNFTKDSVLNGAKYKVAPHCFGKKYSFTINKTLFFSVPDAAYSNGEICEDEVRVITLSHFINDQAYDVEIYDADKTGSAAVIITTDDKIYGWKNRLLYVNEKRYVRDKDNDTTAALTGYYEGAEKTFICENSEMADEVKKGDAIVICLATDGRIRKLERVTTIDRKNEGSRGCVSIGTNKTVIYDGLTNIQSSCYGIYIGSVATVNQITSYFTAYIDDPDDRIQFCASLKTILKLDTEEGRYELGDISAITGEGGLERVMVHDRYSETQDIVVFK